MSRYAGRSLGELLSPNNQANSLRGSLHSRQSYRGKKAQQRREIKRFNSRSLASQSHENDKLSDYIRRARSKQSQFRQTVQPQLFRKIIKNKGKIPDKLTKHLALTQHRSHKSIYQADFSQKFKQRKLLPAYTESDWSQNKPQTRQTKSRQSSRRKSLIQFCKYDREKEFQQATYNFDKVSFFHSDTGRIMKGPRALQHYQNDTYVKAEKPPNCMFLVPIQFPKNLELTLPQGTHKSESFAEKYTRNKQRSSKYITLESERNLSTIKDGDYIADSLNIKLPKGTDEVREAESEDQEKKEKEGEEEDADKPLSSLNDSQLEEELEMQIDDVEEIRQKLMEEYPQIYFENEEYFNDLIQRSTKVEPIDILRNKKVAPYQSLRTKFLTKSEYKDGFKKVQPFKILKQIAPERFYTQQPSRFHCGHYTNYDDEFSKKPSVETQEFHHRHRVKPFPFLNRTSYQNQYLNFGKVPAQVVKRSQQTHVIKEMPFYDKTENRDQYLNKKKDKHEESLNKMAKAKFFKKTKIYADTGAFEGETQNNRTYQGKQNMFPTQSMNKREFNAVPSYLRQYQTQEKQTYMEDQFKNYDRAKKQRMRRVKRMLEIMKQFSLNKTKKLQQLKQGRK